MLFPIFAMFVAGPMFNPLKGNVLVQDAVKQQGTAIDNMNKTLGCHKPDPFKVVYDQRQADIAAGADPKLLPPLKQI
jgi:hypothetical protein